MTNMKKYLVSILATLMFTGLFSQTVNKKLYLSDVQTLDRIDPVATGDNTIS